MQATLETRSDGALALLLDEEAARAVFASVLFAARFHDSIAPLSAVATRGLELSLFKSPGGEHLCQ